MIILFSFLVYFLGVLWCLVVSISPFMFLCQLGMIRARVTGWTHVSSVNEKNDRMRKMNPWVNSSNCLEYFAISIFLCKIYLALYHSRGNNPT